MGREISWTEANERVGVSRMNVKTMLKKIRPGM